MAAAATASSQRLPQVLGDRENALATLLVRPDGPKTLLRRYGGEPERLGRAGGASWLTVRIPLKRGVPGEALDIQMQALGSTTVERVRYRCLSISGRESIEVTPEDHSATWHAAQLLAASAIVSGVFSAESEPKRSAGVRIVSSPKRPQGMRCRVCGRRELSRDEYNWRRRNGYAVWRCQHRRKAPRHSITGDLGVVAALAACALVLIL